MSELKKEWFEPGPDGGHTVDAKDAEIAELRESLERTKLALNTTREQRDNFWSQRDAARAEVERLQGELRHCNHMNRDLTAEVDRWKSRADAHEQNYNAMLRRVDEVAAERDDLQARIDQPDAAMVDERKGKADRREIGCDASLESRLAIGRDHTRVYVDNIDCNGTVKCARSNDRRRTTGTIADRKEAS